MALSLTIVTPTGNVVKDLSIDDITLPAADGEVTILPGHIPYLTTLGVGVIRTDSVKEGEIDFFVDYGFVEVRNDKVSVFAESLEPASDIDLEKAEKYKAEVDQTMINKVIGELEYAKYLKNIEVAHKRLELAKTLKMGTRK